MDNKYYAVYSQTFNEYFMFCKGILEKRKVEMILECLGKGDILEEVTYERFKELVNKEGQLLYKL